ncbi:MAG: hypothetical protein EWV55_07930 [Microcystis viridis Mv_BB_P_19951000_S69]|uniref:Uncharacterized protein n=1 Tax=Microcystis viridis Mv_BB_P_19951000_S68D TaxID=2486270 RepID=A0A552HNQ7_MICVR|nr:MAG: hypothetical protein EWV77_12930 [Microcystis viridis Mv_BB_P_19951000_S68D]TRU74117.1 MAG: hypothetical protein EWV47_11525 [Microcystis viridis Mv_BB_P_19951000_S68]TRU76055.1 MAG: hypothetical protein EWV55_07930 [Microcystis viridis Mv_BB_P_19951000_S69]TRU81525.1 MAG: hypothetical protein EWV46_20650 [Microcystis viridis Mv_BB_P_19951000_S69D]
MIDSAVNRAFYLNLLWQPPTSRLIFSQNPTPHTPHPTPVRQKLTAEAHTLPPRTTFSANPS